MTKFIYDHAATLAVLEQRHAERTQLAEQTPKPQKPTSAKVNAIRKTYGRRLPKREPHFFQE